MPCARRRCSSASRRRCRSSASSPICSRPRVAAPVSARPRGRSSAAPIAAPGLRRLAGDAFARLSATPISPPRRATAAAALALYQRALELRPGDPLAALPLDPHRDPAPRSRAGRRARARAAACRRGRRRRRREGRRLRAARAASTASCATTPGSAQIALESASQADPSRIDLMHRLEREYAVERPARRADPPAQRRARADSAPSSSKDRAALLIDTRGAIATRDQRPDAELAELYRAALAADPTRPARAAPPRSRSSAARASPTSSRSSRSRSRRTSRAIRARRPRSSRAPARRSPRSARSTRPCCGSARPRPRCRATCPRSRAGVRPRSRASCGSTSPRPRRARQPPSDADAQAARRAPSLRRRRADGQGARRRAGDALRSAARSRPIRATTTRSCACGSSSRRMRTTTISRRCSRSRLEYESDRRGEDRAAPRARRAPPQLPLGSRHREAALPRDPRRPIRTTCARTRRSPTSRGSRAAGRRPRMR